MAKLQPMQHDPAEAFASTYFWYLVKQKSPDICSPVGKAIFNYFW